MSATTASMFAAGAGGFRGIPVTSWPNHCLAMIGLTVLLVARSVSIVRRVALRQAAGEYEVVSRFRKKRKRAQTASSTPAVRNISDGAIRPVRGSPIVWKELRVPFIRGGRRSAKIALSFSITALFVCYFLNYLMDALDEDVTHSGYAFVFVLLGLITNIVLSSTTITGEKESGTWPILLTTPLDGWQIIIGKAIGVFRRCLPIWLFLAGHLVLFILVGYIHPVALFQMALVVAGALVFLGCSGLYFSSVMKRTTSAVVANFGFIVVLWLFIPIFLGYMTALTRSSPKLLNAYLSANPLIQTIEVMTACSGSGNAQAPLSNLDYSEFNESGNFTEETMIILISTVSYVLFGLLLLYLAERRIRRNIF
jgi:ABC-type transport system involved in multi-copper enzyme maturation permease subunit